MQTIFEGTDVAVFVDASSATKDIAVFSFSGHGMYKQPNPKYGDGFLQRQGVYVVFFVAKDDHWWQSPEMELAIAAANSATVGVSRRITYGQSMGGFGAAAFANALNAAYLITAPQLSITPGRTRMHKVWQDGYKGRTLLYPDAADLLAGGIGTIIYDSLHPVDTTHADLLKGLPGKHQRLIVPMASHFVPMMLTEAGVFSTLIADLICSDNADFAQHRRIIRAQRIKSKRYIEMLNERLTQRKGPLLWRLAEGAIVRFLRGEKAEPSAYPGHFDFLISFPESKWGQKYGK